MLAKVGAESAQYWDIHNSVEPEGGDYGYRSRASDEQIGPNVPRPSFWAFQKVSDALRGQLVEASSGEDNLTTYLATKGNRKSLVVINKSALTSFNAKLAIPGFSGKAKIETLAAPGQAAGTLIKMHAPDSKSMDIKEGQSYNFPSNSITTITIE